MSLTRARVYASETTTFEALNTKKRKKIFNSDVIVSNKTAKVSNKFSPCWIKKLLIYRIELWSSLLWDDEKWRVGGGRRVGGVLEMRIFISLKINFYCQLKLFAIISSFSFLIALARIMWSVKRFNFLGRKKKFFLLRSFLVQHRMTTTTVV